MARILPILATVAMGTALITGCASSSKTSTSASPTTTAAGVTVTASTGPTVNVVLGDTSGTSGPMTLTASPASVPAGDVTFVVTNSGTIDHEMIVLKTSDALDKLPVVDCGDPPAACTSGANKVDEGSKAGETGDPNLKPGVTRTFTIKGMTAGTYALVCNLAQHYQMGMRAAFTVT